MSDACGQYGGMTSFNLFQLHFKAGCLHQQQKPSYYKALYVSEKNIPKAPPPVPQQFVETRWMYIHQGLKWRMKFGKACAQLGRRVLEYISKNETHFRIWEDVLKMPVNPTLKLSESLCLSSSTGSLSRHWSRVRKGMKT